MICKDDEKAPLAKQHLPKRRFLCSKDSFVVKVPPFGYLQTVVSNSNQTVLSQKTSLTKTFHPAKNKCTVKKKPRNCANNFG